eukprot:6492645-Prymnesium_polylepis.4
MRAPCSSGPVATEARCAHSVLLCRWGVWAALFRLSPLRAAETVRQRIGFVWTDCSPKLLRSARFLLWRRAQSACFSEPGATTGAELGREHKGSAINFHAYID